MKHLSIKSFILLVSLFSLIACNDSKKSEENTDDASAASSAEITSEEVDEEKANGPFGIESGVIQYLDKSLEGATRAELTFYFANHGKLVKLEEVVADQTSIYIFNDDTKKGTTKFSDRKANKMLMRQGEINRIVAVKGTNGFKQLDNEDITGKSCDVWANNAVSEEGDSQVKYWIHKGIPLREINRLGGGYDLEAISFEERSVDNSEFSLPNGEEMPVDIFAQD
jgi:hypothetical protein